MQRTKKTKPRLIAIVGGSGSGKSWLADQLQRSLGENAARLSLDDFYRDRSHLTAKRRSRINFDHPRAIDWEQVERALGSLANGRPARVPKYDFATHARTKIKTIIETKPVMIVDGLWLLRRPALRRLFSYRIFVSCPSAICLERRLKRDLAERGRGADEVKKQYLEHVVPMQKRFVCSQRRWANLVIDQPDREQVGTLAEHLKQLLAQN